MGHRFVVITHRGRRTGKTHRTAVEVVDYDAGTGEVFVVSAYGDRSDWYRNIMHSPPEVVGIAGKRFVPELRVVPPDEERERLSGYYSAHTADAKFLSKRFLHADETEEAFVRAAGALPMVAFRPKRSVSAGASAA